LVAGADRSLASRIRKLRARPIGNDASQHLQLDVFGEIYDAFLQTVKAGMAPPERAHALRPAVLNYLASAWRQPDEGIWEVRGRSAALRPFESDGLGRIRSW